MSTDWDSDNPFAPEEKTTEDFFNRSSKYIVSSTQVAEPAPEPAPATEWERPRSVLPRTDLPPEPPVEQVGAAANGPDAASELHAAATEPATGAATPGPAEAMPARDAPPAPNAAPGDRDEAAQATEELYLDAEGLPTLFDVVIPGDRCRAESLFLPRREAPPPPMNAPAAGPTPEEIEARVHQALIEALPDLTRRTSELLRDSLEQRLHQTLHPTRSDKH